MLDPPNPPLVVRTAFPAINQELSWYIIPYTKQLLCQNLLVMEVELLYSKKNQGFNFPRTITTDLSDCGMANLPVYGDNNTEEDTVLEDKTAALL
jgi:hypothetical protein